MNRCITIILLTCLALLSGCNGASDETTNSASSPENINLVLNNSQGAAQQSFNKDEQITLTAQVTDSYNQGISNLLITFSADIGNLEPATALTNSNGIATTVLNNTALDIGAGTITASVSVESSSTTNSDTSDDSSSDNTSTDLTSSSYYEYLNNDSTELPPVLSTQLLLDGVPVNQFNSDKSLIITTTLTDSDNQPLNNKIVQFSADVGVLIATSALTINGIAHVTLTSDDNNLGAGVITATYQSGDNADSVSNSINYEILPKGDAITNDATRIGSFDDNNTFIEGKIKLSIDGDSISAGGTLGLSIDLVDSDGNSVNTPTQITFTSNCVENNHATIDSPIYTINGTASTTFEDIDCAGESGISDVLIASTTLNGITINATEIINITGEQLGSIEFVSASPQTIVLKGSGGEEISTLTFKVKSNIGNPMSQQKVNFSLNTDIGDITLSREEGLTNSQGLITTQVKAGTVPTAVRVTAQADMTINTETITVQTQSDLLSINTGLPEQRSLTISASILNPEAHSFSGETSTISARLADNFNNPVPDGTTVNFTTEGGVIEPSCSTLNGFCSVTWTSAEPRVDDHRITILATAIGHETFFDTNGNNTFDDEDGSAIDDNDTASGFTRHPAEPSGFIDMSEAWRDDNENLVRDAGEVFLDFNNNQDFTPRDGKFNGPQCQGSLCPDPNNDEENSIHVRKALILIMSGSQAKLGLSIDGILYLNTLTGQQANLPDIASGAITSLVLEYFDSAEQMLPVGSTISISSTVGSLEGTTSKLVQNTTQRRNLTFKINNTDPELSGSGSLQINIVTPKGVSTNELIDITLL